MTAPLRYLTLKLMRRLTLGLVTLLTAFPLIAQPAAADDGGNPQRDFQTTKAVSTTAGSGTLTTSADQTA